MIEDSDRNLYCCISCPNLGRLNRQITMNHAVLTVKQGPVI